MLLLRSTLCVWQIIPADLKILEGGIKMDTKVLTKEPVPWRVPRDTPAEPPNPASSIKPEGYAVNEKARSSGYQKFGGRTGATVGMETPCPVSPEPYSASFL